MQGRIFSGVSRIAGPLALALALAPVALASNFGSGGTPGTGGTTNGVWLTPNANWAVAEVNLTAGYSTQLLNTLVADYAPTDLNVNGPNAVTSCTGSSPWDLCVFDSNYGDNGLYGWNACAGSVAGSHPNQTCSLDWVRLNLFPPLTNNLRRSNACHEVGHAVGLRHPAAGTNTTSCMVVEIINLSLSGHDRNHLNAQY